MCFRLVLLTALAVLLPGHAPAPAAPKPTRLTLLVPAYFYPGGEGLKYWDALIEAQKRAPVIAIVNPASGPGTKVDPNYTQVIARATKAGVLVIGYVSTSYAKRPRADVEADVQRWLEFYPSIGGIFFDEQTSGPEQVEYYVALRRFVREKRPKAFVVTNPGVAPAVEYVSQGAADAVCIFEHHEGYGKFKMPAWAARYTRRTPSPFYVLPYGTPDAKAMRARIDDSVKHGFGYIFVTDDVLPNPWDGLPPYWEEEVEAVRRINTARQ